ncbi:DUF3458 domain-containing protein [Klebsiella pneumoniae]
MPFELYDNEGKVIPLQKGGHPVHSVLNVTQAEQTFVFDNVGFQPVPALLCEFFSACETGIQVERSAADLPDASRAE